MAKLTRSVGIAAIKTNLPRRSSIGSAIVNLAGNAADEAFRRTADKRTQEANAAAEAMDFERDENGILIAPEMPRGNDGLIAPNIYSRQYSDMAGKRYLHQMQLDVTKSLNRIAIDHRNDPNGFEAASSKYLQTTLDGALPEVRAEVDLMGQGIQVGHFNRLVRERSEWEFKKSQDIFASKLRLNINELVGAVQGGADPISATLLHAAVLDEYSAAVEEGLVNGAGLADLQLSLNQEISKGRLAHLSESIPADDVSEMQFIKAIEGLVEEDGQIEVLIDGRFQEVDVANVFPSRADRQEMINNIKGFMADRITTRNRVSNALDRAEVNQYLAREYPKLRAAIDGGYHYDADFTQDMLDSVVRNPSLFDVANNLSAITDSHNEDLLDRNRGAADLEAAFNGLEIQFRSLSPDMMQMMNDVSKSIIGTDFMTAINGEVDPDPLSRQQVFNQLKSMLSEFGGTSSESMPEHIREFLAESMRLSLEHQRNAAEVVANAPDLEDGTRPQTLSDLPPDQQIRGISEMQRSQPGVNLTQTKPAARYHDDQLFTQWGEADPLTRTSWGNVTDAQFSQRMSDIEDRGIIPSSLTLWTQGALQNIQGLEPEEFTRLMDYSNFIFDSNRLSEKAETAFGSRQTAAMWAMATLAGPSVMQDDNQVARELVDKAMRGETIVRDFYGEGFSDEQRKEMIDSMEAEFIDNYVEWWPGWFGIGDKDELSIVRTLARGNTIEFAPGFVDRFKQLAIGHANLYGLDTERGREQAYKAAHSEMKQEGWVLDKDAVSNRLPDTIFGLGFLEGVSDNLITDRPSAIWRNDSLRSLIDDEEVIQSSYKVAEEFIKNSTSWAAYNKDAPRGVTPKVGINVKLVNDGLHTREDGTLEYGFIAYALDFRGRMRPIQDEVNLNNNKVFFFSLTQAQIEARRQRIWDESKTNAEKNAARRKLIQDRDELNRSLGIDPTMMHP